MVKLSQQLLDQRLTRTERVREQQKQKREIRTQEEAFKILKARAKVKQEELSNITSIEKYKEKYQTLDPELQPFFETPASLTQQKTERMQENKSKVNQAIADAKIKLQEKKVTHDRKMAEARDYYSRHRDKGEWYNREINKIADKWDEDQQYNYGLIRGYQEGLQQLGSKDLKYEDIRSYAYSVAQYEEDREEARNQERIFKRQQTKKITDLQEAGYKPFIIEKSYKGVQEEAYLEFYKPSTADWKKVATFQAPRQTDISKLKLSKLGRAEVQRSLIFAGKEFKFKSYLQTYKDPSGKISTIYGSVGKTEDVIIKEAQDKAYAEWQEGRVPIEKKPIVEKVVEKVVIDDRKWYDKSMEELFISKGREKLKVGASFVWTSTKDIYGKIPKGRLYFGAGGLLPYKTGKKDIDITAGIETGQEFLGKVRGDVMKWAVGSERIGKIDIELEKKYQPKYQATFEEKYMKQLIYEETTFEKATKEFGESAEAKALQKEFQKEYGVKYKELSQTVKLGKKWAGGSAAIGLSFGQLGLSAIKTPKAIVSTGGLVYTGVGALKLIPTHVGYTVSAGLFTYGTYKAFSPTSTVEEAGGGLITAAISGAYLGYGTLRYLKSPVIKTKIIKPKISAKARKLIGFEQPKVVRTDIYGKTIIKETTKYPRTLSKQVIAGRRTIVTTKIRKLLKLEEIYKGVPYAQPKGYTKAIKKLTKYGYTTKQAKTTLRYTAPRIIKREISAVNTLIYGEGVKPYSVARATVITRQPVKVVEARLGIKTRAARTIKDVYFSEKHLIKEIKGYSLIRETSTKTTGFLTKKGGWYQKLTQAGKTSTQYERMILAKASKIKTGYLTKEIKGLIIGKEYKYQVLKEVYMQRQVVPLKYQKLFGKGKAQLIKSDGMTIYIDESKLTGIKVSKVYSPKKIPKLKNLIRDIQDPITKIKLDLPKASRPSKAVIDQVAAKSTEMRQVSRYWGKGLYERTDGGLAPLKQAHIPDLKIPQVKDIIKIKQLDRILFGTKTPSALSLAALTGLKAKTEFKTDLKLKAQLKSMMRTDQILKEVQVPQLKQTPALKQALKLSLGLDITPKITTTTLFDTPSIPRIKIPTYKTPTIIPIQFWLKGRVEKKLRQKRISDQDLAYLPDFTARALGLKAETISEKKAKAKLKKILTGLEIRKGVIIK